MKNHSRLTNALKSRNRGLFVLLLAAVGIFYAVSYVKTGISLKQGAPLGRSLHQS
ncbi:MAG: hypothetical protein J0G29_07375 [Alphaproteobacteria bacterium]|nr:hypothetical protein [Alphaproteobacteria bacterium]